MTTVTIRSAHEEDLQDILSIYNTAVLETTGIWNDTLSDLEGRREWWLQRAAAGFPVLVAEWRGRVAGYGSYGPFRSFDGFANTVEHSVYTDPRYHRRGVASAILSSLVKQAETDGHKVILGAIAAENEPSLALHAKHGFVETGRLPCVGRKFGRWLDLVFMQKVFADAS